MPEQQRKERELKQAFIQHLPERIANIEHIWTQLTRHDWNPQLAAKLKGRVQNLTGSSGRFGLIELSESSLSLELFINALHDTSAEQRETGTALIGAITHEAELLRSRSGMEPTHDKLIYLLHVSDELIPGLVSILKGHGCAVLKFDHPDDLEREIQRRLPEVIVVDGALLHRMALLNRELAIQQDLHKKRVRIVCLSQTRDLEQRLLALRNDIDAYFTTPFNIPALVDKIIELATPKKDRYRILIVEDDQAQADFVSSLLIKNGMKTQIITEPMQVMDALDQFRPDLILMDLYMPRVNGLELTTIIREQPEFISTPIVFLSGEQDPDKKLHALSVGADDFLSKPIRPEYLINTIRSRIQRAKILEKRYHSHSLRDPVSGLYNRRYLYQSLEDITAESQTHPVQGGLLYIKLNPSGEPATRTEQDHYLANLGNTISELLEQQDVAARIDEQSFALLLIRPHIKWVLTLAEQLLERLDRLTDDARFSPRIGIATLEGELDSAADLIANASVASPSPQTGGQRIQLYAESVSHQPFDTGRLPQLLEQTLLKSGLRVVFAALRTPRATQPTAHQLKFRLPLPDGQYLSGHQTLALASENRLGTRISQWLIEQALSTLESKRSEGRQITLFVNQTSDSIMEGVLLDWLLEQLRARQMVGTGLVLEYAIADLGKDLKTAKHHLQRLNTMGIRVSLAGFAATAPAIKVLDYLRADFVRLAGPILKAGEDDINQALERIHRIGSEIILPATPTPDAIASHWKISADLLPATMPSPIGSH